MFAGKRKRYFFAWFFFVLICLALLATSSRYSSVSAQNKKGKAPPVNQAVVRDANCPGVWMGPFIFKDPALIPELTKQYTSVVLGPVPIDLTVYTCLKISTAKDSHNVDGNLIGVLKNQDRTIRPLIKAFGKIRSKCAVVGNFWAAADISSPEIRLTTKEDPPGTIAQLWGRIDVGGQRRNSTEIDALASLNFIVPLIVESKDKKLFVGLGWVAPGKPTPLRRFWDGVRQVFISDANAISIANFILGRVQAEPSPELSLGLTKLNLKFLTSKFEQDWNFNLKFSFEAPEAVLKELVNQMNSPKVNVKAELKDKPC